MPNTENNQQDPSLGGLVKSVQDAQFDLVEGVRKLKAHETDPQAHGLNLPDSPLKQAIGQAVKDTIGDSVADIVKTEIGDTVNDLVDKRLEEAGPGPIDEAAIRQIVENEAPKVLEAALPEALPEYIDDEKIGQMIDDKLPELLGEQQLGDIVKQQLPSALQTELANPESAVNVTITTAANNAASSAVREKLPGAIIRELANPDSAVTKVIDATVGNTITAELAKPDSQISTAVSNAASSIVQEKLPEIISGELDNPESDVAKSIASQIDNVIQDKIESGELTGGNGGGNEPGIDPDNPGKDPDNPGKDPDNPDTPDDPQKPEPPADKSPADPEWWAAFSDPTGASPITSEQWDAVADPTGTGGLVGGPMYSAPTILGADYWRAGDTVFVRFAPDVSMSAAAPVKYSVYADGGSGTVEVEVYEQGMAELSFRLPEDQQAPAKLLVAAVAIDAEGNRSAVATRIFKAVPASHALTREFLETGSAFAAPKITAKDTWVATSQIEIGLSASDGKAPTKYEVLVYGLNNLIQVNAGEKATFNLPEDYDAPDKLLVMATAIDAQGRRGASATKILQIVSPYLALTPVFLDPAEDGAAFNNEHLVFHITPFGTYCNEPIDLWESVRYRVLDAERNVVFDSNVMTGTQGLDRYAAYAPDILMDVDAEYTLQARVKGATLDWGNWGERKVKVSRVAIPKILTPASGAEVDCTTWQSWNITAGTSAFNIPTGGMDVHEATDWKVCTDNLGLQVVAELKDSNSLVNAEIDLSKFKDSNTTKTLYLFARHKAQVSGHSAWSNPVMFKATFAGMTTPGGRKAYRTKENDGTVMVCNIQGQTVNLKVRDARDRTKLAYRSSNTDCGLTKYAGIPTSYFGSSAATTTAAAKTLTDAQLNAHFAGSGRHDAATAKANTDKLAVIADCLAAKHCRNLGADLPNIQELAIIYCEAEFLDSMDPTVASYPANKLSGWNIAGVASAWSSTEYNANGAWNVHQTGYCDSNGLNKANAFAVVPVQEIED